jgi:Spy/CpxP family protein refolding chaperone
MITSRWITAAAVALALGGSVILFADEPKQDASAEPVAAAQAAENDTEKQAAKARLTKPWKELSSLNDEQRTQIAAIHRKAVQEIKAIERREREEIMALLNDEQKSELQALVDKEAAQRKARKPAQAKSAGQAAAGAAGQ